jgi:uncharacterized protein YjiS (DUF1127 family)
MKLDLGLVENRADRLYLPGYGFLSLVTRVLGWIKAAHETRRATRELMALDDRLLADIGLKRGEIEHAVLFGRVCNRSMSADHSRGSIS